MAVASVEVPKVREVNFWIMVVMLVIAAAGAWWALRDVRGLPEYDYWYMLPTWLDGSGLQLSYSGLYERSNEHIVVLPKLVYLLNYLLTGGNDAGLAVVNLVYSLVIGVVLARMIGTGRLTPIHALLLGLVVVVCAFPPFAAHNFFFPMSGIAWIGANLFVVLAAYAMFHAMRSDSVPMLGLAVALALLSSQSYSTGMLAVLALSAQALVSSERGQRLWGVVLFVLGVALALYIAATQNTPNAHAHTFALVPVIKYMLAFLGGGLTRDLGLSRILGGIGCVYLLVMVAWTFTGRQRLLQAFWIALACYAIGSGVVGGMGRALYFPDMALASRYATLPSLFWISLLGLTLSRLMLRMQREGEDGNLKRTGAAIHGTVAAAAVIAICVLSQGADQQAKDQFKALKSVKNSSALMLYTGVTESNVVWRMTATPGLLLTDLRPILEGARHVPFDGTFSACPRMGSVLHVSHQPGGVIGYFDSLSWIKPLKQAKVSGWAAYAGSGSPWLAKTKPGAPIDDCIVLADEKRVVRGAALGGIRRDDVAQALKSAASAKSGWQGYVLLPDPLPRTVLKAYVRSGEKETWFPLSGGFTISGASVQRDR